MDARVTATAAVELRAATVRLGHRTVLDGVTLDIPQGRFVGVLGPNGAGKTTLLRTLLGLVPLSSGSLSVLGRSPARGDARIGYVPQSRATTAALRLSGRDVVACGAPWFGGAADVDRALATVSAEHLAKRRLGSLSGGERQRVLLAQALLGRPALLLLDEPMAGLDPPHQASTVALARTLSRELGATVLMTAHEVNPLIGAVDLVLYLGGGGAALGPVEEVVNDATLSRLYGAPVEVVRAAGRLLVVPGAGAPDMGHC